MKMTNLTKWNIRVSAVYAVGVWTIIGSCAYLKYNGRFERTAEAETVEEPENPNQVVYQTAHYTSIIIYKKDFVPYTTRVYNFFFSRDQAAAGGGGEK
ncbi:small integral membrane protein 26-like [Pholidichthys leucotaenia]